MLHDLPQPIIYLITSGATTSSTTPESVEFQNLISQFKAAVFADISFLQIREKSLSGRVLYQLTEAAAEITRNSETKLLVNDRADIARAAGADGVQLTGQSLPVEVVRRNYGTQFLIGASTHSLREASAAKLAGADLIVLGPVFETESKRSYGAPLGLKNLQEVTQELSGFPVIAIGGVALENITDCFAAGASGIAAIRLLSDPEKIAGVVNEVRRLFRTE
jgi:thiamine-phosphate pyrophosphorylase